MHCKKEKTDIYFIRKIINLVLRVAKFSSMRRPFEFTLKWYLAFCQAENFLQDYWETLGFIGITLIRLKTFKIQFYSKYFNNLNKSGKYECYLYFQNILCSKKLPEGFFLHNGFGFRFQEADCTLEIDEIIEDESDENGENSN